MLKVGMRYYLEYRCEVINPSRVDEIESTSRFLLRFRRFKSGLAPWRPDRDSI
jgi:hypothetical protein